ncbi:MAG: prephenate dehydrogenase [Clostridia bacterium]|nr:prephenate dehydrogenase [Clostridia bacterium]
MNIGIVGLGLIGASFGKSLKKLTDNKVYGFDINPDVLLKAELVGAIDEPLNETKVADLDLLVISVYPRAFKEVAKNYLSKMKDGAILMDFCGIKRGIEEDMKELSLTYPHVSFIGAHPMAGREFSGIDRSISTLFEKATCVVVPVKADIFTLERVRDLFLSVGFSEAVFSTAYRHDEIIAFTSQLCHIVSNAFIKSPMASSHFGFSAGSYRDLTRVARLNPTMWTELMMDNRDLLKNELDGLIARLLEYSKALGSGDEQKLYDLLKEGSDLKISIDKGKIR